LISRERSVLKLDFYGPLQGFKVCTKYAKIKKLDAGKAAKSSYEKITYLKPFYTQK
jgi:hypothetical protein